ncbi:MAG: prolyl oligopeptidase family serine peptidase [Pyrinomonadaceae bacterium]
MLICRHRRARFALALIVAFACQLAPAFAQEDRLGSNADALTVRDIMAEPSIAGMRPEGEKVSPDGALAAFLWSERGREPRDLYVVRTSGSERPKLLVRAVDKPQDARSDATTTTGITSTTRDEARTGGERKEERVMQRDAAQTAREQTVSGIEWSPDSKRLLFSRNGDLYIVGINGSSIVPRRLTRTVAPEIAARWLADNQRILYQSAGNLYTLDVDHASLVQLTREGSGGNSSSGGAQQTGGQGTVNNAATITGAQVSDDGTRVAYVVSDNSKQRAIFVPDYTGEFVTAPTVRRGWTDQRVQIIATDGAQERATLIKLPAPEGVSYIRGVRWTQDDTSLVVDRIDRDTKRRQLFLAAVNSNANAPASETAATLVDEETDAKWVAPLSRIVEPSPKNDALLFASERDGFNHLYLAPLNEKKIGNTANARRSTPSQNNAPSNVRQLTRGNWEVNWASWLPDGATVVYSSTEASTAERHLYALDTRTGKTERLPTASGMNTDPQVSKNGATILYEHSEWNAPNDLYALRLPSNSEAIGSAPQRLTDTVPARFKQINWARPQFVEYTAKDGKPVKARIYTPPDFDKTKKYPAVVFVHGAGYLQNVVNGWNNYYREAMFNHILARLGYIVLDVDYRGSLGYGREWRTDVYDFLGGLDLQDELDGIDYVVQNYAVDPRRVGIYGGSYGGFMAEMAAMRAPEKIACAAALRPVADWKNYYASSPVYTTERLGFPDKNPEAYRRSSPVSYADKLQRPLLILHGFVDDNVFFQDSVQLVEKLIELGKTEYFDVMFYPKESHGFTKPESWTDEYARILKFFDAHLTR